MKFVLALALISLLPNIGRADSCSDDEQTATYRQITTVDQLPRLKLAQWLTKHGTENSGSGEREILQEMQEADAKARQILVALWDQCGRPSDDSLSKHKVEAVLLVALHGDLDTQLKLIDFLRNAAGRGFVSPKQMSTLEERFRRLKSIPQPSSSTY